MIQKISNSKNWWNDRSQQYDNLQWATDCGMLDVMWELLNPESHRGIWDVGCGTGIFSFYAASKDSRICIVGSDSCSKMIDVANDKKQIINNICHNTSKIKFRVSNIEKNKILLGDQPKQFSYIVMRNVLHHLTDPQSAMDNIHDHLKLNGKFLLVSAIAPSELLSVQGWYEKILRIKDDRNIYTFDNIRDFLSNHFKLVKEDKYVIKNMSIKNWLNNNALSKYKKQKLFDMHLKMPKECRHAYNMKIVDGGKDILIDVHFGMFLSTTTNR